MKKSLLSLLFAITFLWIGNNLNAQSNWEAGLRFGDGVAADVTIPFKAPRVHAAAYFKKNFGIGAYFDWLFALNGSPTGLKFYPGIGPELYFGDKFNFAVAGDFGVEYAFDFPLTIGFDWRPRINLIENTGFYGGNWGLIARFRFGEGVSFSKTH
jgi:hypothetical protein